MTRLLPRAGETRVLRRRPPRWRLIGVTAALCAASAGRAQAADAPHAAMPAAPPAVAGQARVAPLDRPVSVHLVNVPLVDALRVIDREAHLGLAFTSQTIPADRRVSLSANDMPAGEALRHVLEGTGVTARETPSGQIVLEKEREHRSAVEVDTTQYGGLAVRVVDTTSSAPLEGVEVTVDGTVLKATTNRNGASFFVRVPAGVHVVRARLIGYVASQQSVEVFDRTVARLTFALRMSMTRLQEVVTTATGKRRRLEVANDITVINVDSVMATAPISSVTDLLETRVPGLTVQHTSGAPGDPSRLRLRGTGSVYANNDPIVIVDGVRVYSAQSDARSGNLAGTGYAAPSPLDQIDPQSIATIEVVKGPSAATLYGSDAANGVILITTKHGRPGPAHWRVSASRGVSYVPGRFPNEYLRLGHDYNGALLFCQLGAYCGAGVDSVVRFQALNAPDLTVLGHGGLTQVSVGVDGGSPSIGYSLTASIDDETGIPKLPGYSIQRYEQIHSAAPPPWMLRPQSLSRWTGTGHITAQLGRRATASITSMLTRERQQRSSLETQLSALMSTYVDRTTGLYYQVGSSAGSYFGGGGTVVLVPDFYRRVTDAATNFTNSATVNWQPLSWLTGSADVGLNLISRSDEALLPRGMLDTLGSLQSATGSSVVSTVNLRGLATKMLPLGFRFQLAMGANYTKTSLGDLETSVQGLALGTTGLNGAATTFAPSENVSDAANAGWYVEPSIGHKRFFFSTGLRFDGGSTYGTHVTLPTFPKLGGSWLISDESWFPFKRAFNTLRLRGAYGQAGVEPGITDRLRLYQSANLYSFVNGGPAQVENILTLGNTKLRPERSAETEFGFDADLFSDRISVSVTGYRKVRRDALLQVPVAPSVYGSGVSIWENIGVIRNTGLEMTVTSDVLRTDLLTWSWTLGVSRNRNLVVSLAPGMQPISLATNSRVAAGYPLFGIWAKPILGFADANHDGVIEANEVQVGDTAVFMGSTVPDYQASLHTTVSLFRGALTINAALDYQHGFTQINTSAEANHRLARGLNDPSAPFSEQAAVAVMPFIYAGDAGQTNYGIVQTVSTLRFNSLSIAFGAPPSLARRLGTSALTIALQGSNLGLHSNYRGVDPNVNAYSTGNLVADTGVLPQPRSWQLTVSARY